MAVLDYYNMKTYLVFIIQAYQIKNPDGSLLDVCQVELIDTNLNNAIKRAKKLVTKDFYRISNIIERHYDKP